MEEPYKVVDWFVTLNHLHISIYLYGMWWTTKSSGMLKCGSWYYSIYWCTMMGGMNNYPYHPVKTSNVHPNCDLSPVFNFHIFYWNEPVSTDELFTFSIGIKPNFITFSHLHVSWLNIVEVRGDVDKLFQGLTIFSLNSLVFNFLIFFVGLYIV